MMAFSLFILSEALLTGLQIRDPVVMCQVSGLSCRVSNPMYSKEKRSNCMAKERFLTSFGDVIIITRTVNRVQHDASFYGPEWSARLLGP